MRTSVSELPTEGVDYGLVRLVGWLADWLARSARRLARNDEGGARIGTGAKKKKSKRVWRNEGRAGERVWVSERASVCRVYVWEQEQEQEDGLE